MMMRKHWKLLLSTLLAVLVLALTACSGNGNEGAGGDTTPAPTPTAQPTGGNGGGDQPVATPTPPPRDLGGIEIVIGDWFTLPENSCTESFNFAAAGVLDRMRWEDRAYLEQRHNFRIRQVRMGNWNWAQDNIPLMLREGSREVHVWTMEPQWFLSQVGGGAFAPIPEQTFHDTTAEHGINWIWATINAGRIGGNLYSFNQGHHFAAGVYFNMRLFEEAGLPRDYPFLLQQRGEWTWDNFLRVARTIQRRDAEGNITVWPITSFHQEVFRHALPSNNASIVSIDPETGRFVNTTNAPEFFEVLYFLVQMREEMLAMHEMDIDGEWNFFVDQFNLGNGAMRVAGHYVATEIQANLQDPWGFVAFPRGPSAPWNGHMAEVTGNFFAIPHVFSPEEVDKIMYAFALWHRQLPGTEPDDWKIGEYLRHYDRRSVDETMVYWTRNPEWMRLRVPDVMPVNIRVGDNFAFRVWTGENTAASILEEAQLVLNEYVARSNVMLFGN
jgi:ABC-type glycerol-3-phosphate transport system substrate-binding protein